MTWCFSIDSLPSFGYDASPRCHLQCQFDDVAVISQDLTTSDMFFLLSIHNIGGACVFLYPRLDTSHIAYLLSAQHISYKLFLCVQAPLMTDDLERAARLAPQIRFGFLFEIRLLSQSFDFILLGSVF